MTKIFKVLANVLNKKFPYVNDNPDYKWSQCALYLGNVESLLENYQNSEKKNAILKENEEIKNMDVNQEIVT